MAVVNLKPSPSPIKVTLEADPIDIVISIICCTKQAKSLRYLRTSLDIEY